MSAGSTLRTSSAPPRSARFSADEICGLLDLAPDWLSQWRLDRLIPTGEDRGSSPFTLADILSIAVTQEISARADIHLESYAEGLGWLVQALAAADVERLDDVMAIVGPRSAELWDRGQQRIRAVPSDWVAIPLGPILSNLRDRVFS
jgi:hypothetical protein